MQAKVYWIPGPWKGRLGIVPRPRGGEWLRDEVLSWREADLAMVVSLLTADEAAELNLAEEERASRAAGVSFRSYPIVDRTVPASPGTWMRLITDLRDALVLGKNVAAHCRQSVGRAALVAAALLIVSGVGPEEALQQIAAARGCPVPDTDEQRAWLTGFAASLSAAGRHG